MNQDRTLHRLKQLYADVIDTLNDLKGDGSATIEAGKARLIAIAITEAQGAQMWAVKAVTWK